MRPKVWMVRLRILQSFPSNVPLNEVAWKPQLVLVSGAMRAVVRVRQPGRFGARSMSAVMTKHLL